jgi:hypothetical protein
MSESTHDTRSSNTELSVGELVYLDDLDNYLKWWFAIVDVKTSINATCQVILDSGYFRTTTDSYRYDGHILNIIYTRKETKINLVKLTPIHEGNTTSAES